jgi:hypothetical protein
MTERAGTLLVIHGPRAWMSVPRGWQANEATFRAGNELIGKAVGDTAGEVPFMGEGGEETCLERVPLTVAEYEAVRARFTIVEKGGQERALVERSSRRAS